MKKFSKLAIFATLALIMSLISLPANTAFAELADGTHDISYEVQEAGGGSTSIADGYFSKPAKLTVKDGVENIEVTLTSADMIKSLSVQGTPVDVVSDSGDTRVVKFDVKDASKPVNMDMHVIVPEMDDFAGYDQDHGAQAVFDVSDIPAAASAPAKDGDDDEESSKSQDDKEKTKDEKAAPESEDNGEKTTKESSSNGDGEATEESSDKGAAGKEDVDNPPTGDNTPIGLYIGLLVGSIVLFAVYKFRFARN